MSSPRFDPAPNKPRPISDARRLSARSLLVLGCVYLFVGSCCGGCGLLGSLGGPGDGSSVLAGVIGSVIAIGIGVIFGGSLIGLRYLILQFNKVGAILAVVLASLGVIFGFLGVCGAVVGMVMGKPVVQMLISLGISALILAAFGQLVVFLMQVIREPD